jgi:putative transposase
MGPCLGDRYARQGCGERSTHQDQKQHKGSMVTQRGFDPNTYTRRNSHRLPSYDYRSSGAYFITICTEKRQRVLEIPSIHTTLLGHWQQLPQRFPGVRVDAFVIMPDHVHGILWLDRSLKDAPTVGRVKRG